MTEIETNNLSLKSPMTPRQSRQDKPSSSDPVKRGCIRIFIILVLINLIPAGIYFYLNRPTMESGLDSENPETRLASALHFSQKNDALSKSIMVLLCSDPDAAVRQTAVTATAENAGPAIFKPLCRAYDKSPDFSGDNYCVRRYLEIMAGLGTRDAAIRILNFPGATDSILYNRHVNALSSVMNMIKPDILARLDSMTPIVFQVFCQCLVKNRDHLLARHIQQYISNEGRSKRVIETLIAIGPRAMGGIGAVYNRSITPAKIKILNMLGECGYGDIDYVFRRALLSSRPKLVRSALENILKFGNRKAIQALVPDVLSAFHKNKEEYHEPVIDILGRAEMNEVALHIFKIVLEDSENISKVYVPLLKTGEWSIFSRLLKPGRDDNIKAACALIDFYGKDPWPSEAELLFSDFCAAESRPERRMTILDHIAENLNQSSLMAVQVWSRISNLKTARMISKLNRDFKKQLSDSSVSVSQASDIEKRKPGFELKKSSFESEKATFQSKKSPLQSQKSDLKTGSVNFDFSFFDMNRYGYTKYCHKKRLIEDHVYDNEMKIRKQAIGDLFIQSPSECVFIVFELGHRLEDNDIDRLIADNYKFVKPLLLHNSKVDPKDQALFRIKLFQLISQRGSEDDDLSWIIEALIPYENHFSDSVRKRVMDVYKKMKDNPMASKRLEIMSSIE